MLAFLLASMLALTSTIRPVSASGTIYIRADGSIDPPTAPISTVDNVTYTLTGNITGDADGIVVERSNIIVDGEDRTVEGTGTNPYKGLYLSGIANVTIKNTNVKHFYYGIGLYSSSDNGIIENEITNNSQSGIGLFGSSGGNSIYGNNITNNGPPAGHYGGVGWAGIELSSGSGGNSIYGNNITNNPSGIHLYGASHNNINGNDLRINGYGISVFCSYHNIVCKNNITGSESLTGIWLQGSSYNNIYGNNIKSNKDGMEIYSSFNNNIYHNNFVNNTRQIDTTPTYVNTWDNGYPSGGNYWSDYYDGVDEKSGPNQDQPGSDGIWDWPYVIDGNNGDQYPLTSPSTPTLPVLVTETIHIKADGSVDPPTAPIQRDRETYTLTQDVVTSADGILIERSDIIIDGAGCWLWGNESGSGLSLHSLNNVTIKNIRIEGFYDGVHLDLTSRIVLFESRIIGNSVGILIENSDNIALTGNAVTHNAYELGSLPPKFAGILLLDTTNSQIANNNIADNLNGIYLHGSSNNTIFGNTMTTNQWWGSILLERSRNNTISSNDIRTGSSGILLIDSSDDNVISKNNVANNTLHGIRLLDSSNNTLSQNIMNGNEYGFGVEGSILSNFIHSIDTSNVVDGKPIQYLLNLNGLMIDPVTHPEIGYLAIINCTNIVAEGLDLTNKWQGLLLAYTKDSIITDNNVTNSLWCGIQLVSSNNNTISRNSITNTDGAGIKIFYSSNDNTISENKIAENRENGIELYTSSDNLIFGNNVTNNDQYGIVQFYSDNNTISRNNIENEKGGGLALASSSDNTISENDITNNEQGIGVWLHGSSNTKLRNNHMSGNRWSFGVDGDTLEHFLNDVDASNIVDGKPIYYWVNRHGETIPTEAGYVALINSTEITVQNLHLENNIQGLLLAYTENSTIKNNHITNNYDGIDLAYSSSSSISGNNIENNSRYGVCLLDSFDNEIFVNNLEENTYGIVAVYSSSNTVFGNNIENGWLGIYLERSSNNRIFHNNFLNNSRQTYSYASTNIWDDGHASGGNWWSDYTGEDLYGGPYQNITGSDGIGDTPYVIDANNQDRYPLMNPFVLLGDLNHDGATNILDVVILGKAYGSYPGHPRWNPDADFNGDSLINILDAIILASDFGKTAF
jgi:parallel beta-helix repeat protein